VLYVHPSQRHLIGDKRVPIIFVEGIKKALAIVSAARTVGAEVLVIGILGVWNWLSDGKPISDMLGIPLQGRQVLICFDDDVFTNPDVADAARRLVGHATERGAAAVKLSYLPPSGDGSKTGADDYFARGHSYREFATTFRPFDPADLAAERLKRGDRLRAMLEDLRRTFWASEWKGMGGHSSRDVYKVLVDEAPDRGKLHQDGLRVRISRGELARLAKVSSRTLQKAIERLEEMGLIYRDNEGRRPRDRGGFVLRASVNHYGEATAAHDATTTPQSESAIGTLHLRSPRLRWSSPGRKGRRGVVAGTRRVRLSIAPTDRPTVKRLGKIRGALLDALDVAGGHATIAEMGEALHRANPRDLVRFKVSEKGHDGPVVMLLEAGIVEWVSDVETRREVLRLAPNWLQRLEEARELGKEIEADQLARRRHRLKSHAYRSREKVEPTPHWTNTTADGAIEDLRPEEMSSRGNISEPAPERSPAAEIVLDFVLRLGRIRPGLLEQIWLEDHGGDLQELRRAVDESGVQRERLREFRNAVFLYPPADKGEAA
jgi:DNA-binding transcriptional ArsR family regulator